MVLYKKWRAKKKKKVELVKRIKAQETNRKDKQGRPNILKQKTQKTKTKQKNLEMNKY